MTTYKFKEINLDIDEEPEEQKQQQEENLDVEEIDGIEPAKEENSEDLDVQFEELTELATEESNNESLDNQSENREDRKSTRLNSSHVSISYAVFCLKKKKNKQVYMTGICNDV